MTAVTADRHPRLWIVDDQRNRNTTERLRLVLPREGDLQPYCGTGMLESFLKNFDRQVAPQGVIDFFLLDVYMPVPHRLSAPSYWKGATVSERTCGFALARWLVDTKGVSVGQIRIASANVGIESDRSQFGFNSGLVCLSGWHELTTLYVREWLNIPA
jgi:hypothetical protein